MCEEPEEKQRAVSTETTPKRKTPGGKTKAKRGTVVSESEVAGAPVKNQNPAMLVPLGPVPGETREGRPLCWIGEGLTEMACGFIGVVPTEWKWAHVSVGNDEEFQVATTRGHWWMDAESIRSIQPSAWRSWILELTGRTTLDRLVQNEMRWIVMRGLEQLDDVHLGAIREALLLQGGRTYRWLLLGEPAGEARFRGLLRLCSVWAPDGAAVSVDWRLHRAGLLEAQSSWAQVLRGQATMEILEPFWLVALSRDTPWPVFLLPFLREVWHIDPQLRQELLNIVREIEKQPMQREIFRWRWLQMRFDAALSSRVTG